MDISNQAINLEKIMIYMKNLFFDKCNYSTKEERAK